MTESQSAQLAAIRERRAKMPAGDYTKREQHDDWGLVRRPDGWPFADVCMSVDYGHEEVGKTAPDFVDAKREFVSHAVADIDTLLTLLADAERERDEAKKRADECEDVIATTTDLANTWARESSVPEADGNVFSGFILRELIDRLWVRANERWIKQVRRNDETTADLAAATERAEQAADARQAEIVTFIRSRISVAGELAVKHSTQREFVEEVLAQKRSLTSIADAIERGEFRAKGGGDG